MVVGIADLRNENHLTKSISPCYHGCIYPETRCRREPKNRTVRASSQLLCVCKTFYIEASAVLYGENLLYFSSTEQLNRFINNRCEEVRQCIREVMIGIGHFSHAKQRFLGPTGLTGTHAPQLSKLPNLRRFDLDEGEWAWKLGVRIHRARKDWGELVAPTFPSDLNLAVPVTFFRRLSTRMPKIECSVFVETELKMRFSERNENPHGYSTLCRFRVVPRGVAKVAQRTFAYELDRDDDAVERFAVELYGLAGPHGEVEMSFVSPAAQESKEQGRGDAQRWMEEEERRWNVEGSNRSVGTESSLTKVLDATGHFDTKIE